MTREDKVFEITRHCDSCGCTGCVYEDDTDSWCEKGTSHTLTDQEVDEVYNKIFGISEEPTEPTEPVEPIEDTPKDDVINQPSHYTHGGMECIDEMKLIFGIEAVKHFCLCNAWKYRKRCLYKNGEEDIKKSDWYIQYYKKLCEEGNTNNKGYWGVLDD